jgi:hypothetical protein
MSTFINAGKTIWYILGGTCIILFLILFIKGPASSEINNAAGAYRELVNFFGWVLIPMATAFIGIGVYLQLKETKSRVALRNMSKSKRKMEED